MDDNVMTRHTKDMIYSDSKNRFNVWQVQLVECITCYMNFDNPANIM